MLAFRSALRRCSAHALLALTLLLAGVSFAAAQGAPADPAIPHLKKTGSAAQLIVDGKPLVLVSGELHNSSASSLDYMEPIWPRLTNLNMNSVIATISWELVEPEEGKFDFSLIDGLIDQARQNNMKLVFIWFATWKNADSTYVPAWVKTNQQRFPRCQHRPGKNSTQLSAFAEENMKADARAFAAVMRHIREVDGKEHTVVTMQVENEAGVRPVSRDHSALADAAFNKTVPAELMQYLVKRKETLVPEFKAVWEKSNFRESGTWSEIFGQNADEMLMAWHVAKYIGQVAAAGKQEYPIPMYANAWLVSHPGDAAGTYPSGGPIAKVHDVWRAAAPAIDMLAPDIYLPTYKDVCADFVQSGNPLFIPECRNDELAGPKAFYALGRHHAICFAPFAIDATKDDNPLSDYYAVLRNIQPLIEQHQGQPTMSGFLQYQDEKTASFDIGDFRADIEYPRVNPNEKPDAKTVRMPGCGVVIALEPDTFLVAGANCKIRFAPRDGQSGNTDFLSVEEGFFGDPSAKFKFSTLNNSTRSGASLNPFKREKKEWQWIPRRRLNGDEATYRATLGPTPTIVKIKAYHFE